MFEEQPIGLGVAVTNHILEKLHRFRNRESQFLDALLEPD